MPIHPLAVVDDPEFDEHRSLEPHPERPERLGSARRAVELVGKRAGRIDVSARRANDDELERVHTARYLERLGQSAGRSATWDADTYSAPKSVDAARRAAGGSIELVDALLSGRASSRGIALVRPPGHHARPDGAMGFCLLNNVAVAAAHARARGVGRVLVLDFDVHHGNGTQDAFYAEPEVLFVSLHQFPFYPGTGAATQVGEGHGRGFTLNVPLAGRAGDAEYDAAFERLVVPVVSEFAPAIVLLSAGFDAHRDDPLGGMLLSDAGYRAMMRRLLGALPDRTPIGAVLEGGYDLGALESALVATLEVLTGIHDQTEAPHGPPSPRHAEDLARAGRVAAEFWRLG